MTKYYPLSDTEPGDERIGIGDPTTRTEAIWQKDWDIKPFLYKVYETAAADPADPRPAGHRPCRRSTAIAATGATQPRRASSPTRRCSAASAC